MFLQDFLNLSLFISSQRLTTKWNATQTLLLFATNYASRVSFFFTTDKTGRAIVPNVNIFLREVLTLSSFIVRSIYFLSVCIKYRTVV